MTMSAPDPAPLAPVATARRGGLTLRVALPKATYWAGEGGEAALTLRNDGTAPVALRSPWSWGHVWLTDGHDRRVESWHQAAMRRGGPSPKPGTLAPGEEIGTTARFGVPPDDRAGDHTYTLQALARVIDPAPTDGHYTGWADLTAALPIGVAPPGPAQALRAHLEIDRAGWRLTVTDADGRVPPGPCWGEVGVTAYRLAGGGPLPEGRDGHFSGTWSDYALAAWSAITLRVWVAAPGFVAVAAEATVPAPALRRVAGAPRADVAAIVRACGPWPPSLNWPPSRPPGQVDPNQIRCAAQLVAGQPPGGQPTNYSHSRVTWREAAAELGVDVASGPAPDRAVWLVQLDAGSAVGTVVVFDAETGAPLLLLEPQAAP